MEQTCSSESYEFINSSLSGSIPVRQDTRRLIRRQAMSRVAAARRQRGSWGKHNRLQYPTSQLDLEEREEVENDVAALGPAAAGSSSRHQGLMPADRAKMAFPATISSSGYESMRILYGFDLLDVSALTTFHTGRITAQVLHKEPLRLAHVLRYRQWSYISFLPSRYGYTACLDDAARCVAARIRQWIKSPAERPDNCVLSLYSKSLTSLQSALNDPILHLKPEVLCATAILAIYELLDSTGNQAWVRHVAGASTLLQLRGPQRYPTDFEKSLFLAQAGPIYTEALLNNDRCFLEQDSWQNVFRTVIFETDALSDSSRIVVFLWTIICPIPSLFKDVQTVVCNFIDMDLGTIGSLFARVRGIRALLMQWRREFEELSLFHVPPEQLRDDKQYETLGIYMANLIIINRLSVSLNTRAGSELEDEAQDLARQIIQLEQGTSAANPRASLFMAFKLITAQAALDTKDEWQQAIRLSNEDATYANLFISSRVFKHWVNLKGRKITSN